ncbi:hypothetical protein [Thermococcus sp. GR6]|uniref:hypothetical protein n=1 Tax=Thermococcus sp. GR6 TaxID=1638256 RepID=UPI0014319540|nr:hypothetical protein [Thermococcus sp. GR6]NJE42473.1 hypothetical protein [Thermococcus sp. GR6]
MKEIGKERPLDVYFENFGRPTPRKSRSKSNKHSTMQLIETSSSEPNSALIKGTIARTDPISGLPHLDELTHHLIAVATASLKFNSPDVVLAALIHDYFKPVFDFRNGKWYHFITDPDLYSQLLSEFDDSTNISNVANISQWHHKRENCNEICQIENSELISTLETSVPFILPTQREYTVVHHLRVLGKYRMFILALLKEKLAKILSEKYSERFQKILGVSRIRYEYRPVNSADTLEDAGRLIKENDWRIEVKDNTMVIPLPSRFHKDTFYFEYYEGTEVVLDVDTKAKAIRGVKVPFGKALSTVYLTGSQDAYLLYVDAGFGSLSLEYLLDDVLSDLKQSLSEKKRKNAFEYVDLDKVVKSLSGDLHSDELCVLCGEPGEPIESHEKVSSILKAKFTDTWLLLTYGTSVCPVCKLGFEIEELFRGSGMNKHIVQEALLEDYHLIHSVPIFGKEHFMKSISSKIWLELLSEIYYSLYNSKELQKITKRKEWVVKFYLNPKVLFYPYVADLIPQVLTVALRYSKKKFVLQSGLHSNIVFPGSEKDLTPEEFSAMRRFYISHPSTGIHLLQKIRNVYSPVFGVPNVEIRKGGVSRARKRKG